MTKHDRFSLCLIRTPVNAESTMHAFVRILAIAVLVLLPSIVEGGGRVLVDKFSEPDVGRPVGIKVFAEDHGNGRGFSDLLQGDHGPKEGTSKDYTLGFQRGSTSRNILLAQTKPMAEQQTDKECGEAEKHRRYVQFQLGFAMGALVVTIIVYVYTSKWGLT